MERRDASAEVCLRELHDCCNSEPPNGRRAFADDFIVPVVMGERFGKRQKGRKQDSAVVKCLASWGVARRT